jgi:allantoicase
MTTHDFTSLPDLASRALAGSVVHANDELFAQRENLIRPESAVAVADFGQKGKVYDGWETRRRREPGHDHAIVRLGVAGVVRGVVIDTAWFTGNYPPFASVEATSVEGFPSPDDLTSARWEPLVEKSPLKGDARNAFAVDVERRFTHVRLNIFPDGGVARLRVHGEPVADPRFLAGTVDLAALENGADVVDCSDQFYSSARNLLVPGRARTMGEGWENARRRDGGNDHVTVRLAARGHVDVVEIDTSYFVGNAAGWAEITGFDSSSSDLVDVSGLTGGIELMPRTRLQPDTRHLLRIRGDQAVTHVRLDVFPDGGLARLRVNGRLADEARRHAVARWLDLLPESHALQVLMVDGGVPAEAARELLAQRPFSGASALPDDVLRALGG